MKVTSEWLTHEWHMEFDKKFYRVIHRQAKHQPVDFDTGNWTVIGGGNYRNHYCEPEGKTHKAVVNALKNYLKGNDHDRYQRTQPVDSQTVARSRQSGTDAVKS